MIPAEIVGKLLLAVMAASSLTSFLVYCVLDRIRFRLRARWRRRARIAGFL